jgi:Nitrile hydratase beta subunit, N-terminal
LKLPSDPLAPSVRANGEVVFDEVWQAQALGLVDCLVHAGVISASQWAEALGEALRDAVRAQAPDDMETYYNAVISALEALLQRSGTVGAREVAARKAQWERAYLNTPHGQPVELRTGEA